MAHIPNDIHIPMNEIPGRLADLTAATNGKSKEIVVYCASGMRSFGVAHFLNEQGFVARNLSGGITRWQMAKGPVQQA
jgi:rhodanese-related sulfurtransferase